MSFRLLYFLVFLLAACQSDPFDNIPDFDSWWDYGDPAGTELRFRQFLQQDSLKLPREIRLEVMTQLARTQGLQGRFDQAHAILDSVAARLPETPSLAHVRYYLERGRVYNSEGTPELGVIFFLDALGTSLELGQDFYAIDAAHMLGIATPLNQRLTWNERALALAETSDEPRARMWVGSLYNNIGWLHFEGENYPAALTMFRKNMIWQEDNGGAEDIRIARWSMARTLRAEGIPELALEHQQKLEAEIDSLELEPDGYVFEEIAECLLAMDSTSAAKPYFRRAYIFLSKDPWLQEHEPERLERLALLGE